MLNINVSNDDFSKLLKYFNVLKDYCNDADIRGGKIRQRSNDKTVIFEADIPFIADVDLPVTNLKQKIDVLKLFENDVSIEVDENKWEVYDSYLVLSFSKPLLEYLDNKFISEEELSSLFTLDESNILFEQDLDESTLNRGKDNFDGFKYLPIAASADVEISDGLSAGADVGYAISLETGGGGDFLWRGVIRYQVSEDVDVTGRYNSLTSSGSSLDYLSIGAGFRF